MFDRHRRAAAHDAPAPFGPRCDPEAPRDEADSLWKVARRLVAAVMNGHPVQVPEAISVLDWPKAAPANPSILGQETFSFAA
jgi:hypothetical protein